jgi:hypothetical protein
MWRWCEGMYVWNWPANGLIVYRPDDVWLNMEQWWRDIDRENRKTRRKSCTLCLFVRNKFHINRFGREQGTLRWKVSRVTAWALWRNFERICPKMRRLLQSLIVYLTTPYKLHVLKFKWRTEIVKTQTAIQKTRSKLTEPSNYALGTEFRLVTGQLEVNLTDN